VSASPISGVLVCKKPKPTGIGAMFLQEQVLSCLALVAKVGTIVRHTPILHLVVKPVSTQVSVPQSTCLRHSTPSMGFERGG
jgi:hypothetical protein